VRARGAVGVGGLDDRGAQLRGHDEQQQDTDANGDDERSTQAEVAGRCILDDADGHAAEAMADALLRAGDDDQVALSRLGRTLDREEVAELDARLTALLVALQRQPRDGQVSALDERAPARTQPAAVEELAVAWPIRLTGWWDDLRDSLWFVPAVVVAATVGLGALLIALEPAPNWIPGLVLFTGTPDGARAILSELAGATITVVGLVFSLTVVALQMASSQFTPRLLLDVPA